jgi:hypothetical protein
MDDAQFWQLIGKSSAGSAQADALETALSELPADEIFEFDKLFDRYMAGLYRWDLWAAAHIINGGASEDGFDYFCAWIIGQGEQAYKSAVADPRSYSMSIDPRAGDFDGEGLMHAAAAAHEKVTGTELPPHQSIRPSDPLGEPWEEGEIESRYPKLAAKWNAFHASGIVRGSSEGPISFLKRIFGRQ